MDCIIKNVTIVDGTGKPSYTGDIGIKDQKIEALGNLPENCNAKTKIDATGLTASPGFIDVHSHADIVLGQDNHDELLSPLVMQGVTTFIGGNCGYSSANIQERNHGEILKHLETFAGKNIEKFTTWMSPAEFMDKMDKRGVLLNVATLAGHGTLRIAASGLETRPVNAEEQSALEKYLEASLEMGCVGMSTGLQYFPGLQSEKEELDGCARILKKHNKIFTSHLRSYAHTLDKAILEVIDIGREHDIPVQISHLYWLPYQKGMQKISNAFTQVSSFIHNRLKIPVPIEKVLQSKIALIDNARAQGVNVRFDTVPTTEGFTELTAFLPPYVFQGSKREALKRLKDREYRKQVLYDMENIEPEWPHRDKGTWSGNYLKMSGWSSLRVMGVESEKNSWMEGKTFPEIGKTLKKSTFDTICDLLIEENGKVMVFLCVTFPDDPWVFRTMLAGHLHPESMPATDSILIPIGKPARVYYDCFPRFIEYFVKKEKLLSLEEAIRKSTSLPAETFGLPNRGVLAEGNFADIVLFDLDKLKVKTSFQTPDIHPEGIEHVFINGKRVVQNGEFVKNRLPGAMIRK